MSKQAVILAGGLGTRLRPITEKIPKVLVEVGGKPFLHWQLELLKQQGVSRVLLLCAYLGEQVQKAFGDGRELGMKIDYSFEASPMGTGGALKNALSKLDETFILINGDSFLNVDLEDMWDFFEENDYSAIMTAYRDIEKTPVPANLKVDEGDGWGGAVLKYQRDAGAASGFNAVDSGVYIINRDVVAAGPEGVFQLEELWPGLIEDDALGAYFETERFYDIGTPERLKTFEERLSDYF